MGGAWKTQLTENRLFSSIESITKPSTNSRERLVGCKTPKGHWKEIYSEKVKKRRLFLLAAGVLVCVVQVIQSNSRLRRSEHNRGHFTLGSYFSSFLLSIKLDLNYTALI